MRVAIVIPTFNREHLLALTIASVQRQTISDWGLVVVDDGSTDRTRAVAERFAEQDPRIRVVSQNNQGIAAARNLGIRNLRAGSEAVMFLDDDDVLAPRALESLLAALTDPVASGAHGLVERIDGQGRQIRSDALMARQLERMGVRGGRLVTWAADAPTTFAIMAFGNVIMTPGSVLIRRSALERAGPFREPVADWDMWLRLTMQGHLVRVPDVLIGYRSHPGNESRNILRNSKRKFIVHWRLLWSSRLSLEQRRVAWFGFLYYYADLGRLARTLRRLAGRLLSHYRRVGTA